MRTLPLRALGLASLLLALPLAVQSLAAQPLPAPLAEDVRGLVSDAAKGERPLTLGEQETSSLDKQDASLSNGALMEVWTYEGRAGEEVTFEMESTAFDAFLIMAFDAGAGPETVAHDDDSGDGYNARLALRLPASGPYLVVATSAVPRQRGPYTVRATRGVGSDPEESTQPAVATLPRSQPVAGTLSGAESRMNDGRPYDLWRFESRGGERVRFAVQEAPATVFVARPLGGGAVPVEGQSENGGTGIVVDLLDPGPYLVVVAGREPSSRGDYRLRAEVFGESDLVSERPALRTASSEPADPDERYALLVGIDDYPGVRNDLPSSIGDVELLKRVLVEDYGFDESNVLTLTDEQATREHIIAAFDQHLGQAGLDGVAVFYYSGHGTQLEGNVGLTGAADPEEDGRDEAIVVWGWGPEASILFDDELGALMDRLRAERTVGILDACNSGDGLRGELVKAVTPEQLGASLRVPEPYENVTAKSTPSADEAESDGSSDLLDPARGDFRHLLLAATRPEEFALARRDPWPSGQIASAFTYFLAAGLEAADEQTAFSDLMDQVRPLTSRYAAGEGSRQTPQLEGPAAATALRHYLARRNR